MPISPFDQLDSHCRQAIEDIYSGCEHGKHADELGSLPEYDFALVQLLQRQASVMMALYLNSRPGAPLDSEPCLSQRALLRMRLDDILSISYSKFYHYAFSDLPLWLRQLYTDASILKFCEQFLSPSFLEPLSLTCANGIDTEMDKKLADMVKTLDLAIIMAGAAGAKRGRTWIDEALYLLQQCCAKIPAREDEHEVAKVCNLGKEEEIPTAWDRLPSFSTFEPVSIPVTQPIKRTGFLTHETFQGYLDRPEHQTTGAQPLIISGLADNWPARTTRLWCKPAYLLSRTFGGRRLVPVEIGRSYVDEGWGQELITFREFISSFCDPSSNEPPAASSTPSLSHTQTSRPPTKDLAYLAQHPLLTQIPSLRADITIPDLCYTYPPPNPFQRGPAAEEVDEPKLNAWFGPAGTITPLHTDPYHNLLVQVVGRKYVRLYGPWEGERMRPRGKEGGIDMSNTSEWDVGVEERWDERPSDGEPDAGREQDEGDGRLESECVEFKDIHYVDCILEPGDTLYIPVGWWHYVRSLSVSFSVSFWWI